MRALPTEGLITSQTSVGKLRLLPDVIKQLGEGGISAVIRLSVDDHTLLRVTPAKPIEVRLSAYTGSHGRRYEPGSKRSTTAPFEAVALIMGNTVDFGHRANAIALDKGRYTWDVAGDGDGYNHRLEQSAYFLNIADHQIEVVHTDEDTGVYSGTNSFGRLLSASEARGDFFKNGYTY